MRGADIIDNTDTDIWHMDFWMKGVAAPSAQGQRECIVMLAALFGAHGSVATSQGI